MHMANIFQCGVRLFSECRTSVGCLHQRICQHPGARITPHNLLYASSIKSEINMHPHGLWLDGWLVGWIVDIHLASSLAIARYAGGQQYQLLIS